MKAVTSISSTFCKRHLLRLDCGLSIYLHCRPLKWLSFHLKKASRFYPLFFLFFLAKKTCLGSFHLLLLCIRFQSKYTPGNEHAKTQPFEDVSTIEHGDFRHVNFLEGTSRRCNATAHVAISNLFFFRQVGPLSLVGAALICAGSASLAIFELRSMVFFRGIKNWHG